MARCTHWKKKVATELYSYGSTGPRGPRQTGARHDRAVTFSDRGRIYLCFSKAWKKTQNISRLETSGWTSMSWPS